MERKRYNSQFKFHGASVNTASFHNNNAMGLFKSLITLLIAKILFLQISNLYTNGEISVMSVIDHNKPSAHHIPIKNSTCVKVISHEFPHFIPYVETYNTPLQSLHSALHERLNYRRGHHVVVTTERSCCEGYIQIDTFCVPHCQSCKKGYCSEPNVCTCHAGYRASNDTNDKETCVPVCTNGCINGTCIEPDICSCNEDYWLDSDGFTCRPVCDEECERNYGHCNEPHVCSCRPGYKKTGYDSTSSTCEPVCDHECRNGYCVAPNVCKCPDGYELLGDRFTCLPKCDPICVFGTCVGPQSCFCNDGYTFVNVSVCEPICDEPCKMGTCIAPQTCRCNDGYRYRDENTKYICEPICEMDCSNGTCVAPGVCVCNEGFVYDNQTDPVCKPHCTVSCGPHGKCTSPNTCTCSEGYRYSNASFPLKNESLCEPICERGCQNGDCVGPNYCICHNHFVPNFESSFEAECIPVCSRNCSSHGACIIEDDEYRCKCHYGWTGWDCDQPTICIMTMDFNSSDINRITIRNDTNSTIIQVYENAPYCQCNNSLNKESLCYMIHSDKGNTTPIISCLLSTDLPCYLTSVPHYSASSDVAKIVWPLVAVAILIATILITAAYLIYRRYEKKKLIIGMPTNLFVRKSIATESLLPENVIDI